MNNPEAFEIPANMREVAEQGVERARDAYGQLMDVARKAQDMMMQSQEAATHGALEVQQKAIGYAEANMNASFDFASQLAKTGDMKAALELQQSFAQSQMQAYAQQTQELSQMLMSVAQKVQIKPGD